MNHGRFIIFEGIEGSGKSVQATEFYKALSKNDKKVILTQQPWEEDQIGKLIRKELKDKIDAISVRTLQLLFVANRSNHMEKFVEPKLKEGNTVISDRYWMSTVAYGGAFAGGGTDLDYFFRINRILLRPDVVFFIDVDADVAHKRIVERRGVKERFDKMEQLKILREKYKQLEKIYDGLWININGNGTKEEVANEIMQRYSQIK